MTLPKTASRFAQTIARINLGYDIDVMVQVVAIDYFNGGGLPADQALNVSLFLADAFINMYPEL
jgi:hypothetical protein